MTYTNKWLHGRRSSVISAIRAYGALFLTNDPEFTSQYGDVYEITLKPGLKVFEAGDEGATTVVAARLKNAYERDELVPNLDTMLCSRTASEIAAELQPDHIRSASIYDERDLHNWLMSEGFDLVTFWDDDTALVLDASENIDECRPTTDEELDEW